MIEAIRHIGIVVDDLEASLSFYRDYFGFEIEKDSHEKGVFIEQILAKAGAELRTIKMRCRASEVMIELIYFLKGRTIKANNGIDHVGPTHFAITINNLEGKYHYMKKYGVNFLSPPISSPDGYVRVAFCQAPEGTYVEMVELTSRIG